MEFDVKILANKRLSTFVMKGMDVIYWIMTPSVCCLTLISVYINAFKLA